MGEQKKFEGVLTGVKKVSEGFHRVDCKVKEEGGELVPNAYFLPITPLLSPKVGMPVSFLAWHADSLAREKLTIGGVCL